MRKPKEERPPPRSTLARRRLLALADAGDCLDALFSYSLTSGQGKGAFTGFLSVALSIERDRDWHAHVLPYRIWCLLEVATFPTGVRDVIPPTLTSK